MVTGFRPEAATHWVYSHMKHLMKPSYWKTADQAVTSKKGSHDSWFSSPMLSRALPISVAKKANFINLCKKQIILKEYHEDYKSLLQHRTKQMLFQHQHLMKRQRTQSELSRGCTISITTCDLPFMLILPIHFQMIIWRKKILEICKCIERSNVVRFYSIECYVWLNHCVK